MTTLGDRTAVKELASVDGTISPTGEATIPLADDGLYRGDGVFEVIRLYGGRPFALAEHLDRLERSAATLELPVNRTALERDLEALLAELGEADAQLRIVLTRGGRRLAMTEPMPDRGETVSLAVIAYRTTMILDRVKSLSYAANMQATRLAQARGAEEALLVRPDGIVLEAPTSAIFWASAGGELCTPSLEVDILDSITRARLLDELEVTEGEFSIEDLKGASEAFLASTVREVQPIVAIDQVALGAPGPRTAEARETFAAVVRRELG